MTRLVLVAILKRSHPSYDISGFLLKQLKDGKLKRLQGVISLEKDFETKQLKLRCDLLILSLPRRYNNTPHQVGQMGQVEQKCWD